MLNILLLDCSRKLQNNLKRQGFNVSSGTVGYCNGVKNLPSPVYENEVFIYNPSQIQKGIIKYSGRINIDDETPEYNLDIIWEHVKRGATVLAFINKITDDSIIQERAFSWIPNIPEIKSTKDTKYQIVDFKAAPNLRFVSPVFLTEIKLPILFKLKLNNLPLLQNEFPIIYNFNSEIIGAYIKVGDGHVIVLPEFINNDEVIGNFLHRVIPKIYNIKTKQNLIDQFFSPGEKRILSKIAATGEIIKQAEINLDKEQIDYATENRNKVNTIIKDKIAVEIFRYHNLALQQEDVSLFYLYKIIDLLENKYGGEAKAIKFLGLATEWKFIKRISNESYGDVRHAPKPGEKIKQWTKEDIEKCFDCAEKIIHSYFKTLF